MRDLIAILMIAIIILLVIDIAMRTGSDFNEPENKTVTAASSPIIGSGTNKNELENIHRSGKSSGGIVVLGTTKQKSKK
jgi:hypothetical protein